MLCGLESVLVDFLVLYLVLKVSEKSGISPPLLYREDSTSYLGFISHKSSL